MKHVWAGLLFLCLTLFITFPSCIHMKEAIPTNPGDPILNTYIIHTVANKLLTDPKNLYEMNMFFPYQKVLTYSENFIVPALLSLPLRLVTHNPKVIYNLFFLAAFFLTAFSLYALIYLLSKKQSWSVLGAFIGTFSYYRIAQASHLQTLSIYFAIAALICLFKYYSDGKKRFLSVAAIFIILQFLTGGNIAIFFMVMVTLFAFLHLTESGTKWSLYLTYTLFFTFIVGVVMLFYFPYLETEHTMGFQRSLSEQQHFSADLIQFFKPPFHWTTAFIPDSLKTKGESSLFLSLTALLLWLLVFIQYISDSENQKQLKQIISKLRIGWMRSLLALLVLVIFGICLYIPLFGPIGSKEAILPGVKLIISSPLRPFIVGIILLLILLGTTKSLRDLLACGYHYITRQPFLFKFLFLSLIFTFFLSLGPNIKLDGAVIAANPFKFLTTLPGFRSIRAFSRFHTWTHLILILYGILLLNKLLRNASKPKKIIFFMLILSLALAETRFGSFNNRMTFKQETSLKELPAVYLKLAAVSNHDDVILEYPMNNAYANCAYLYNSLFHHHSLINGYSGYFTPLSDYLNRKPFNKLLGELPNLMATVPFQFIIFHLNDMSTEQEQLVSALSRKKGPLKLVYKDARSYLFKFTGSVIDQTQVQKKLKADLNRVQPNKPLDFFTDAPGHLFSRKPDDDYLYIDLGNPQTVSGVLLWFTNELIKHSAPKAWQCDVSLDGNTWQSVATLNDTPIDPASLIYLPKNPYMIINFPPKKLRYIRIKPTPAMTHWTRLQWNRLTD